MQTDFSQLPRQYTAFNDQQQLLKSGAITAGPLGNPLARPPLPVVKTVPPPIVPFAKNVASGIAAGIRQAGSNFQGNVQSLKNAGRAASSFRFPSLGIGFTPFAQASVPTPVGTPTVPATVSPTPTPSPEPSYTVDQYLKDMARGADLHTYYPAYPMISTRSAQLEKQYNKPGLSDLMKLVGFFESTLGQHVKKPFNYFGMAPASPAFTGYANDVQAADRWAENLSGQRGYLYPILKQNPGQPITTQDINELYSATPTHGSYNPDRAYVDQLMELWKKLGYK